MAMKPGLRRIAGRATLVGAAIAGALAIAPAAHASCASPVNEIEAENCLPGTPASIWDVPGAGSAEIRGFATDISANQGQTVEFKIDTPAGMYRLDIYRLGYYGGDGARKVDTVTASSAGPQPACREEVDTGLIDCGNWSPSARWTVPVNATSGVYIAHAVREVPSVEESHIVFIVRDDDGRSDMLFQTSDTTWQAYNQFGGNSLYVGNPVGRAFKVSYNRPFTTSGKRARGLAVQR